MKEIELVYYGHDEKLLDTVNKEKRKAIKEGYDLKMDSIYPAMNHNRLCDLILDSNFDLIRNDLSRIL